MESNIPTLPYKDWLINQQKPSRDDKEYVPFWLKHIEYCKSGVIVGGIHISGWLYWHLNFFIIMDDQEDDYGNEIRMPINPELRDNEWLLEWAFKQARNQDNKPIMAFGTRRFAKSVIESSQLAYSSFIRENSFYVIAGGSSADINNITNYYDDFYEQRPDCFSDFMINGDWGRISKPVVIEFNHRKVKKKDINPVSYHLFPLKDKPNDTSFTFSRVAVRNLEHGQVKSKEELLAGLTPTGLGWDEALAEYTFIPTSDGLKRIKDINIGDHVYSSTKELVEVIDKIDVGVKPIYRINLSSSVSVDCCEDHIWYVFNNEKNEYEEVTTRELLTNQSHYQIPILDSIMCFHSIVNIELIGSHQAYCLKVDSFDNLFLIDKNIVTHNCGKYSYTKQRSAVKPAIMSKKGKRRFVELMVGTGGNIELATSAKEDFMNADKSGFLVFDADDYRKEVKEKYFPFQRETDKKTGLFVPAEMSMAGGDKIKIPLYEYSNKKFTKKQKEEMEGLYIYVTDWENARERVEKIIADEAAISRDRGKKAQMYYPFQPEHCFLHIGNNPFPVEEAQKAYDRIMSDTGGVYGEYIELDNDKYGNIIVNESDKEPIIEYPFKGGAHDAPIVIYERPIFENPVNIKRGTYIAGFDGAKIATSKVTDSTITMYIYKRVAGVSGFQNQIVASISGRPNVETAIYRQCLLLLRMYNAELLPEQDTNLYKYLKDQKALNYLAAAKGINLRINQKSKAETNYGLPPTSANKNHGLLLLKDYCWEQIPTGEVGENGEQIFTLGVETIPDPMLLKEIIEFGNVDNYDRIVAFYHCLIWDEELRINNISGSVQRQQIQTNTALKLADGYTGRNKKYARRR